MQRTEEFYEFYKDKMLFPQAQPNAAHKKLAELEQAGKLKAVITQNIDGLHQAAGSKEVLELHGPYTGITVRNVRSFPAFVYRRIKRHSNVRRMWCNYQTGRCSVRGRT